MKFERQEHGLEKTDFEKVSFGRNMVLKVPEQITRKAPAFRDTVGAGNAQYRSIG